MSKYPGEAMDNASVESPMESADTVAVPHRLGDALGEVLAEFHLHRPAAGAGESAVTPALPVGAVLQLRPGQPEPHP